MKLVKRCLGGQRGSNQANNNALQDGLDTPLSSNGGGITQSGVDVDASLSGRKVVLSQKKLNDTKMPKLAKAIIAANRASSLDVSKNSLGDPSCAHLAAILDNLKLESLDASSNEMTGNGMRALQQALAGTKTLKRLVLKRNNLGDHGAKILAEALRENQSLLDLNVDRTQMGDEGIKSLASALKVHSHLKLMHLSGNNLGDPGMFALADMIAVNGSLKELWLLECGTSHNAVQEFSKAMQRNTTLQKFAFTIKDKNGRKDLEEKALDEVKKSHKVRRAIVGVVNGSSTLNLSDIAVGEGGVEKLAEVIASADHLKDVKLEKCNLPPEGMEKIAQALKDKRGGLQKVSLSGNKLSDKAAESLVEAFQQNDGLKDVDLGNCGMSAKSTAGVASFVQGNKSLQKMHLGGNTITDKTAEKLADGIKHSPNLKDISMGGGGLTDAAVKSIAEAVEQAPAGIEKFTITDVSVSDKTAESLSHCIRGSSTLKEVGLSNCSLGPKGGVAIADALGQSDAVKKVSLAGTHLDGETGSRLAKTLSTNKAIVDVNLENCKMDARSVTKVAEAMSENKDTTNVAVGGNALSAKDRETLRPLLKPEVMALDIQEPPTKPKSKQKPGKPPKAPTSQYVAEDPELERFDADFDKEYEPKASKVKKEVKAPEDKGTTVVVTRPAGGVAVVSRPPDDEKPSVGDADSEAWEWDDSQVPNQLDENEVPDEIACPDDSESLDDDEAYRRFVVGSDDSDDDSPIELPSDRPGRTAQVIVELQPEEVPDDLPVPDEIDCDEETKDKHTPEGPARERTAKGGVEPLPAPFTEHLDYKDVPELEVPGSDDVQLPDDIHLPESMVPDTLPILDEGVGAASDDELEHHNI
mmetsp:Transcript_16753/g.38733  ORF Transcript_16753/g.38733 Transcript_16753/m.38733 type:complete len:866 (+) Transcript_16753:109-2706(+)